MKGSRKKCQPNGTDSIIATLMGFDQLQLKQPFHEKQRVLSESYLSKVASIALRPGSLVSVGRLCRRNNEIVHSVKGRSEVHKSKGKSGNVLEKCVNLSSINVRTRVSRSKPSGASFSKSLSEDRHESHLGEFGIDFMSNFEEVSKRGYKKYNNDPHLLHDGSSLVNKSRKQNFVSWKTKKEVQITGISENNQTLNEVLALADKISMPEVSDMRLGGIGLRNQSSLQYRSSESSSSSVSSSMDIWNDECLKSLSDLEFEAIKDILSAGWKSKQDKSTAKVNKSMEQKTSQKDILESKGGRGIEQFQTSLGVDDTMSPGYEVSEISRFCASCFGTSYNNAEGTRINGNPQLDSYYGLLSGEGGGSSCFQEFFNIETSLNEFSENDSAYPLVPMENLKRTNEHSPDSVLESYGMNTPPFGCFDSIGLQLQLQALKYESEGTHSEESAVIVSGDEDLEEQFGKVGHDGRKVRSWLQDDKSKNFSYMVDVLDEAGIFDTNSFMDFNAWASLECPINPLVFATLEKKYGKQISWQKSDRQLLFDRINSGLLNIFNPFINFHVGATSILRKLCASFRRDEVEDELWNILIRQENKNSKELDEWFEVQDGIGIICRELETSLFDELVVELASLWN